MTPRAPEYLVPVDVGQAADYTAMGGLRRVPKATGKTSEIYEGSSVSMKREYEDQFHLGYAHRFPLHTPYPQIVDKLVTIQATIPGTSRFIFDATGVGRPVVDMAHEAGLNPIGVLITGGSGAAQQDATTGFWKVPKRELVSRTQSYMQSGKLFLSSKLPLCDVIVKELLAFKMKISTATGHMSFEAWRDSIHDDLVLMLCLGIWWGHMTRTGWQFDRGPHSTHDEQQRASARKKYGTEKDDFGW